MGGQGLTEHSHMIGVIAMLVQLAVVAVGVCYSSSAGLPEDPFASAGMTMLCGSAAAVDYGGS